MKSKKKEKENFFVGKATLYGCFAVERYNHLKSGLSYILSSSPPPPRITTNIVFAVGRIPSWNTKKGSRDSGDGGQNENTRGAASGNWR